MLARADKPPVAPGPTGIHMRIILTFDTVAGKRYPVRPAAPPRDDLAFVKGNHVSISSPPLVRQVLILDPSEDARTVLRTMLHRRGIHTLEATAGAEGLEMARQFRPQVIVLDDETLPNTDGEIRQQLDAESRAQNTPIVFLGKCRSTLPAAQASCQVDKPYHFAPLLRTIEALLDQSDQGIRP